MQFREPNKGENFSQIEERIHNKPFYGVYQALVCTSKLGCPRVSDTGVSISGSNGVPSQNYIAPCSPHHAVETDNYPSLQQH